MLIEHDMYCQSKYFLKKKLNHIDLELSIRNKIYRKFVFCDREHLQKAVETIFCVEFYMHKGSLKINTLELCAVY